MEEFREVLSFCDLHDIDYNGVTWTYDNMKEGERNVRVRLDRVVAGPSWSNWYPSARVTHLTSSRSDHVPVLLQMEERVPRNTSQTTTI
jgi:exonuclease III